MNISVKGDYALKAIFDLAHQGADKPVKIADIAARQKIPQKFLELILAQLKQGGFVQSRRGAEGGYLLARPPDTIMVGEVLRFVEGPLSPAEQSRAGASHRPSRRAAAATPFTEMWQRVDQAVSEIIDRTSFAELAARWSERQHRFVANWEI
jgi:Rrf2 family transcriptional regulator, cysteine metabolism repressor